MRKGPLGATSIGYLAGGCLTDPAKVQAHAALLIAIGLARDVQTSMKNPASFDLAPAVIQPDGSVCMTYRGTNSFNAIVTAVAGWIDTVGIMLFFEELQITAASPTRWPSRGRGRR
jgi:hypothetical protein